ncbi:MAG: peptidase M20 [Gammaproteobacteria bacterium RIFCSPLOWO2_02_FULL_56_15]|nr:MAG: peptidase M20 [Gammaproteobacteria bacterium RIFCSPLOWO2_02_FULL_56_15]
MDTRRTIAYCNQSWDSMAIPELMEYIRIPNLSPGFDPDWQEHGYMDQAVERFSAWCRSRKIPGLELEVLRLPGRTPLLFIDIPGVGDQTILLYGHLDKQPEMTGWRPDLGPWQPVIEGDRLYGRGGADDGYAMFAALIAIESLLDQGVNRSRCIIIIEACEESGSFDLPAYIELLAGRCGKPSLIICLDSGCGNYEQLWNTTSLRGLVGGELRIDVLREGVHSGDASGIVPSSFRILRTLLNRIDNYRSGIVLEEKFKADIPRERMRQAAVAAAVLGLQIHRRFPFIDGMQPVTVDPVELILNRTWRPALSITGISGIPEVDRAGNVLRPYTTVKVSLRLPPTCDADAAVERLRQLLEEDPPYSARVTFKADWSSSGWHAPEMLPWLDEALNQASINYFGKAAVHMGEGGTIPFMGMLGERFPEAQFLITGVLGPQANAHGPNEFLHIPTAKKLSCCVAEVIAKQYSAGT